MAEPAPANPAPPRKRRFFQIHLSTCIVLMFVAGGLSYANCRMRLSDFGPPYDRFWGWPLTFLQRAYDTIWPDDTWVFLKFCVEWSALGIDLLIGAMLVGVAGLLTEWLLRRRERQQ